MKKGRAVGGGGGGGGRISRVEVKTPVVLCFHRCRLMGEGDKELKRIIVKQVPAPV